MIGVQFSPEEVEKIRRDVRGADGLTYQCDPDCREWVIPMRARYQARDRVYGETGRVPRLKQLSGEFLQDGFRAEFEIIGWHEERK